VARGAVRGAGWFADPAGRAGGDVGTSGPYGGGRSAAGGSGPRRIDGAARATRPHASGGRTHLPGRARHLALAVRGLRGVRTVRGVRADRSAGRARRSGSVRSGRTRRVASARGGRVRVRGGPGTQGRAWGPA